MQLGLQLKLYSFHDLLCRHSDPPTYPQYHSVTPPFKSIYIPAHRSIPSPTITPINYVNYFSSHSHVTNFNNLSSASATINASIFQGSALGPALFSVNSHDLKPLNSNNILGKYADDTYLIVSSLHESSLE